MAQTLGRWWRVGWLGKDCNFCPLSCSILVYGMTISFRSLYMTTSFNNRRASHPVEVDHVVALMASGGTVRRRADPEPTQSASQDMGRQAETWAKSPLG